MARTYRLQRKTAITVAGRIMNMPVNYKRIRYMYKVRVKRRKVFYFADWESTSEFCLQAGINIKRVEVV
jgi:hypothetical protein